MFDVTDEELAALRARMTPREVLEHIGQPDTRTGTEFTYCAGDGSKATLTFTEEGSLESWYVSSS